VARIAVAAGTIQEMPGIFQIVQHNIARQSRTCKAWCTRLQWRHNMILWKELQQQQQKPPGRWRESFKELSITWPGGAEHAMKSAAAILCNFYNVK
jgi:hypothetical protein